jgi:hypothetical protein
LECALDFYNSTCPVAVDYPPKGQCILSSILPPPSCYPSKRDRGGKISPLQNGKGPSLTTSKKEQVYVAKACTVVLVGRSVLSGYVSALARTEVLFPAGTARRCRVRFRPPSLGRRQA